MSAEDPETYLRRFAETQLRHFAAGDLTAAECATHVDSAAIAFEETGVMERDVTARVTEALHLALVARGASPSSRYMGQSPLRRGRGSAAVFAPRQRPGRVREKPAGDVVAVPAASMLQVRDWQDEEDVYLLGYISTAKSAWLSVAARTSQPLVPRRHASPMSVRNPRALPSNDYRPTFAGGGMTATDDAGRAYDLHFSGGRSDPWYLGRLLLDPVPPPDAAWLKVHCGTESARIDLRARPPAAEVKTRRLTAEPGESYLLRQAEFLLGFPNVVVSRLRAWATGLSDAVPALRAAELLSEDSPVPGQVAALITRLGGPGNWIAQPTSVPGRWAARLDTGAVPGADSTREAKTSVTVASVAVVLPESDGVTVHLAGMLTLTGLGTLLLGGIRMGPDHGEPAFWLRDNTGGWHSVSVEGTTDRGSDHAFRATVRPPLGPEISRVEFHVIGRSTQTRVDVPLTWWAS